MEWIITHNDAGNSVRAYLKRRHAFSRRLLRALQEAEATIRVNERVQSIWYILHEGDKVNVTLPPEKTAERLEANPVPLDILYEDEAFMVIDKEATVATIPSMNHPTHTLANGILAYYQKQKINSTIHVVTRLDKDTSGLVLIAKNRYSHSLFSRLQQAGRIKREYIAVVNGELSAEEKERIDAPIGRKDGSIIERTVTSSGKQAITDFQIIHNGIKNGYTFVKVAPRTGRTHQIRVHLAHIGHPILGDTLYGESNARIKRHALHCHKLVFRHPLTHEKISIEAPLPPDMEKLW